jgi:hypothetical protein
MTNFALAVGVADLAALAALNSSSSPPRVDGGIYWVSDAGGLGQGRWAQYIASSSASVTSNQILMPADEVGRWHLALVGGGGGGGSDYDADTDAFIARLGGSYSSTQLDAINDLIIYCKSTTITATGTIWDALQCLYIRCLATAADSRLNLKGTDFPIVDDGGTFTAFTGMTLDGTDDFFYVEINPSEETSDRDMFMGASFSDFHTQGGAVVALDGNNFLETYTGGGATGNLYTSTFPYFDETLDAGVLSTSLAGTSLTTTNNASATINTTITPSGAIVDAAKVTFGAYDPVVFSADPKWAQATARAAFLGFGKGLTQAELAAFNTAVETCVEALLE